MLVKQKFFVSYLVAGNVSNSAHNGSYDEVLNQADLSTQRTVKRYVKLEGEHEAAGRTNPLIKNLINFLLILIKVP